MSKRIVYLLLTIVVIVSVTGCATLFKQKSRTVNFDSAPQGAVVYINGNRMGKTPMPLNLSNKQAVTVTFKKEGYEDKTYIINTKTGTENRWSRFQHRSGSRPPLRKRLARHL